MAIDTATSVGDFDATKPGGGDPFAEGDDNLKHIKATLKSNFPQIKGTVTASHAELSHVAGVTSPLQAQIDARAPIASPTFTGVPAVPTAPNGTGSTQAASTAFVQAAIALVNAQAAATTLSIDTGAAIAAIAGQHIVCTNAGAVTITLPATPTAGQTVWVTVGNGRTDNVIARNGQNIMGLAEDMTINSADATVALRFINTTLGWRLV